MQFDPATDKRYRWLRTTLGAIVVTVVAAGLFILAVRHLTTWSPPGVVPIPQAQDVPVTLQDHPRLVSTFDAINSLSQNPDSPEYLRIMAKADQFYSEYLIDPLQGDTIYPGYFALAWRISGEARYLDAARDMALVQCKFPRWQRRPESANFYKIELAYAVGIAYDLLYDQFSESERKRIEERLSEVLDGLIWHIQGKPSRPFWFDAPNSNYYVAQYSAAGLLALCLGDAYPRWREALNFAYRGLEPSIDLLEQDGGWIEGLTYLDFCWGQHAFLFLNSLRVNGGPNRLDEDWYETSVRFALAGILPSGKEQVNFGDNISDPISSYGYLWRARAFFDSPFLESYLDQYLPEPDYPKIPLDAILIQAILEYDADLPLREFPEPDPCQYFPGIEWVMLRCDWTDPEGFYLSAKAGYGGWDHNHVDQGTFILAFDGVQFISDAGRGDFNERKDPEINMIYGGPNGHSVFQPYPYDNDLEWDDFTMYSENTSHRQKFATISGWTNTETHVSFMMNLDGAYPAEGLAKWRRQFVWWKPGAELPGGAVMIFDDADTAGRVQLITSMDVNHRREGVTLSDRARTTREMGYYSVSQGINDFPEGLSWREITPYPYKLSSVVYKTGLTDNETAQLTILLPFDDIARVVCEAKTDENTVGSFVDGYLFEFKRDEDGNWAFTEP